MPPPPPPSQRHSLSRTLPIALLLFAVVPLVTIGLLSLTESTQRLKMQQAHSAQQTATLLASRVRQMIESGERLAWLVASDPATLAGLAPGARDDPPAAEALHDAWRSLMRSHPEVSAIVLRHADGGVVASHPAWPAAGPEAAAPPAPARTTVRWSERGQDQGIDVRAPVIGPDEPGAPRGHVSVALSRAAIARALELPDVASGEMRAALRTPGEHLLLATSRQPGQDTRTLPPGASDDLPAGVRHGWRALVAHSPVGSEGWRVEVVEPQNGYRLLALEELMRFGAVVLAISLLSAWLAWRFARALVQPIRDVARAARAILHGHYLNAHVEVQREDEIGLLAQSFNHMSRELEQRERERDVFGRLVSPEVRDQLLQGELILGGQEVEATVLFSDIRGFTTLCETMKPRDVVLTLNEYFTRMTQAVQRHGGYVNNFMGDAMVSVFGAPTPDAHRVVRALYAAVAMQDALDVFNRERAIYGAPLLQIGIGLASGTALAGQIGSPERCIYTVVGDTVNVASRIEGLVKDWPEMSVFANRSTRDQLPAHLRALLVPLGPQQLKGRDRLVDVYALPRHVRLPPPPPHAFKGQETRP